MGCALQSLCMHGGPNRTAHQLRCHDTSLLSNHEELHCALASVAGCSASPSHNRHDQASQREAALSVALGATDAEPRSTLLPHEERRESSPTSEPGGDGGSEAMFPVGAAGVLPMVGSPACVSSGDDLRPEEGVIAVPKAAESSSESTGGEYEGPTRERSTGSSTSPCRPPKATIPKNCLKNMRKTKDLEVERTTTARNVESSPWITGVPMSSSAWSMRSCRESPGFCVKACAMCTE
mmetsp:Transcript_36777/g.97193  ORF Transcript_36777/g.97193 Transcript_36777/m.97193 type:complete len:237 (+) Transcript_36777:308-1018(+)